MTDPRPPYTSPIWNHHPTAIDYALLPVQLLWMGATLGAVAVAAFLLNPGGFLRRGK